MALDSRIPLSTVGVQVQSPLEVLTQVTQLQAHQADLEARRAAADTARQKAADEAAIRRVLTETNGDVEAALPRLRTIAPKAALEMETELKKQRTENFNALKSETELHTRQLGHALQLGQSVVDDPSYQAVKPLLVGAYPDLKTMLPATYDPEQWQRLMQMGLSTKEFADKQQEGLSLIKDGKLMEGLSTLGSATRNQQEWDKFLDLQKHFGVPAPIRDQFGPTWSPENAARAGQLGIPQAKREELAGQAETRAGQAEGRASTAAHQTVLEQQGAERLALARQRLAKGTGTEQDRGALMQAVIDNPGLWDQITPTERGKIAGPLNAAGFTGFGKPLSDQAVKIIATSESALGSLADLREVVKKNEQYIGPLAGLAALNPYSDARKAQADVDRVRQRVGKTLEGGVLRKEDEEKYKKILATLFDTPETAIYKIDSLEKDIRRNVENYRHQQRLAGRRVPTSETAPTTKTDPLGIR